MPHPTPVTATLAIIGSVEVRTCFISCGTGGGGTEVELTLETSGRDHINTILRHLLAAGYTVEEVLHR